MRLLPLLQTDKEKEIFTQFERAFSEFQQVSKDLLDIAVRNATLRTYARVFSSAFGSISDMDAAFSRLILMNANPVLSNAQRVMFLAAGAETDALGMRTFFRNMSRKRTIRSWMSWKHESEVMASRFNLI